MVRTASGALVGMLAGVACAVLILRVAYAAIARMTDPDLFQIEYGTIYLTLVLGAGFGSLSGALAGFASALLRAWREGRPSG